MYPRMPRLLLAFLIHVQPSVSQYATFDVECGEALH